MGQPSLSTYFESETTYGMGAPAGDKNMTEPKQKLLWIGGFIAFGYMIEQAQYSNSIAKMDDKERMGVELN